MSKKIVFAYRTRLVDGVELYFSDVAAPSTWKDPIKIAANIEEKKAKLMAEAGSVPYSGTFDEVRLLNVSAAHDVVITYKGREPGSGKAVARAVLKWLRDEFKDDFAEAWPHTMGKVRTGPPVALFIGFDPANFLKMLGVDASLPCNQMLGPDGKIDEKRRTYAPLGLWYSNSDYRDIESVMFAGNTHHSWSLLLQRRGLSEKFASWKEPHQDLEQDIALITDLAAQIGMLREDA